MKKIIKIFIVPVLLIGMGSSCGNTFGGCNINYQLPPTINFKSAIPGNGTVILEWGWVAYNNKYSNRIVDPATSYTISVSANAFSQAITTATMTVDPVQAENIYLYSGGQATDEYAIYNLENNRTYAFAVTAYDSTGKTISSFTILSTPTSHPVLILSGVIYVINPDTYDNGILFPSRTLLAITVNSTNDELYGFASDNTIGSYKLSDFSIINLSTIPQISYAGQQSGTLTLDQSNNRLYLTGGVYAVNTQAGNIGILDATNMTMVSTISTPSISASQPDPLGDIEIDPSINRAVVCDPRANSAFIIDTFSNTVVSEITVGTEPYAVAIDTSLHLAYITNSGDNTVSVLNITSGTIITTITVGSQPKGIAVNQSNHEVYVTNSGYGSGYDTVSVIYNLMNNVNIAVSNEPHAISIDPITNNAYVVSAYNIFVIDTTINNVIKTIGGVGDTSQASIVIVP